MDRQVVCAGLISAVVSAVLTWGIVAINHSQNAIEAAVKANASEIDRVDKNTQVIMSIISGRPPKGSVSSGP